MSDDGEESSDHSADDAVEQWVDDVAGEGDRERGDDDPFERIGEGTGPRHGDPFDAFDEGDATGRNEADGGNAGTADDRSEGAANNRNEGEHSSDTSADTETERRDPSRNGLPAGPSDDADEDDPFTTFEAPATDPFGDGETVFDRSDLGDADDGVWERMESTDPEAEAVPGKRYVDVNKHSYCETCVHFSDPPDVACSHEGTEILEFVDVDTVRVADCPVVDERKALEDVE